MATLHIIQGFLGAGKSTFSRKLAEEINALRLNADEWVAELFSASEQKQDWDGCFSKAVTAIWGKTAETLNAGQDVILDIGFWSKASRDDAREKARAFGVPLKQYYIFAPDDVLLARIKRRSGPIAEKNVQNFHAYKKFFEVPAPDEEFILVKNYDVTAK